MSVSEGPVFAQVGVADDLTLADLAAALAAGWRDFLAFPLFGLFFAAFYVAGGAAAYYGLFLKGEMGWYYPVAAGFPLLAPFTAVGLYEVSRRREAGLAMDWGAILGALRGRGDDQLLLMGGFIFVAFGFWITIAHAIFAIFTADLGAGSESLAIFFTPEGLPLLLVGSAVGAVLALVLFMVTVFSLPMLVDRDVDVITAIIVSVGSFSVNRPVLLVWAALIAFLLLVAMLPMFLGLFVILPLLGHATWHLYRRTVDRAAS